jgi:hypothetical protein
MTARSSRDFACWRFATSRDRRKHSAAAARSAAKAQCRYQLYRRTIAERRMQAFLVVDFLRARLAKGSRERAGMSFLRHAESIAPMTSVSQGASGCADSLRSSDAMSSSRLFLGRLLSSRACLRFAGCERFSERKTRRTMIFQRTATTPLTYCLSPRVHFI